MFCEGHTERHQLPKQPAKMRGRKATSWLAKPLTLCFSSLSFSEWHHIWYWEESPKNWGHRWELKSAFPTVYCEGPFTAHGDMSCPLPLSLMDACTHFNSTLLPLNIFCLASLLGCLILPGTPLSSSICPDMKRHLLNPFISWSISLLTWIYQARCGDEYWDYNT